MITVILTQDKTQGSYTVQSLTNTCKLDIGQKIDRAQVDSFCAFPKEITVRIVGVTDDEPSGQVDLFSSITKALPGKPGGKQPTVGKGGSLKALPTGSLALAITK